MKEENILIARKKVRKTMEAVTIPNTLESLQKEVGGYIEAVHVGEGIYMICNEEGKFNGSEPNFNMGADVIMGDVIFVGTEGEEFASLSDKQHEAIVNVFA